MWNDFSKYLSSRRILGGKLYKLSTTSKLKSFVKKSLNAKTNDRSDIEEKWARIYQNSETSKFYSTIKQNLDTLPSSKFVLEHGCSIGIVTSHLANSNELVFGVDRSFSAIQIAKKTIQRQLGLFCS